MIQKFRQLPLERRLYLSFASVLSVLLLLAMGITFYFDLSRQRRELDYTISSTAAYIASLDSVEQMLENGYPDSAVSRQLDILMENMSNLNVIAVYNTDCQRFYHTNRRESGETELGDDSDAILAGSEPYITTGYGTLGIQRRAFHAVHADDGTVIGFVMTSIFENEISEQNQHLATYFLLILAAALIIGLLLSRLVVKILKDSLMGHHPTELLDLYRRQANVLNAIEDGIVATDTDGRIAFANLAACRLFEKDEDELLHQKLTSVFPESGCVEIASTAQPTHNRSLAIKSHQVLACELPIQSEDGCAGVLSIFHDKTEMLALSDELSGTKNMLDTLRAFSHEFMNKLHVILGYLQTGDTERAQSYIINTSLVSGKAIRETADCIRVSAVCALVIGKMMHAAELGISLTVTPDSYFRDDGLLLPEQDYVTVIGNLLENAIEELSHGEHETKEIHLGVYCRSDYSLIVCEDTGGGISEELRPVVFQKGVSSKGNSRGMGLYLINDIVKRNNGTIDLETERGAGTCFTVTFTREEPKA